MSSIMAAILLPIPVVIVLLSAMHVSSALLFLPVYCLLEVAILLTVTAVWLSRIKGNPDYLSPKPEARYTPHITSALFILWISYTAVTALAHYRATGRWPGGADSFILLLVVLAILALTMVQDWHRARHPAEVPAFTQKRISQIQAAMALPTRAEARVAMRPLVYRGYARIGLLGIQIVLMLIFAPRLGIGLAFLASFALVALTFLVLHRAYEL